MKKAVYGIGIFVLLWLVGCTTPQRAVVDDGAVRIGVILPLTGIFSTYGAAAADSIRLYFDDLNGKGGIDGKKITYFIEDNQSDGSISAKKARYLIQKEGVQAILGPITSRASIAAGEVCQDSGVPMISIAATLMGVTELGDFIFRNSLVESYQIYIIAKFAIENLNSRRGAAIWIEEEEFTEGLARTFKEEYEALGGQEVLLTQLSTEDPEMEGKLRDIIDHGPDVLYMPANPNVMEPIARKSREMGLDAIFLGSDLWLSVEENLDLYEGSYFIDHHSPEAYEAESRKFVEAYRESFQSTPDSITALAYESAMVLAHAFREAGSTNPAWVRDALERADVETIIGRFRFDEMRNPIKPAIIKQIREGEVRYVTSVYPEVVTEERFQQQLESIVSESREGMASVAVLNLALNRVSPDDSLLIVDLVGSALATMNAFRVLERSKRDKLLEEMEYSQSDLVDEAFQIEIGKQLAADNIITGSMGVMAERYILNIKLIDVETGETMSASYKVYKSMTELVDHADQLVIDLVSKTQL